MRRHNTNSTHAPRRGFSARCDTGLAGSLPFALNNVMLFFACARVCITSPFERDSRAGLRRSGLARPAISLFHNSWRDCIFARTSPQSSSLFDGYARPTIHCGVGAISTATIIGTTEATPLFRAVSCSSCSSPHHAPGPHHCAPRLVFIPSHDMCDG